MYPITFEWWWGSRDWVSWSKLSFRISIQVFWGDQIYNWTPHAKDEEFFSVCFKKQKTFGYCKDALIHEPFCIFIDSRRRFEVVLNMTVKKFKGTKPLAVISKRCTGQVIVYGKIEDILKSWDIFINCHIWRGTIRHRCFQQSLADRETWDSNFSGLLSLFRTGTA